MKIIVSSKNLVSKIEEALRPEAKIEEVGVKADVLTFHGELPIELYGHSKYSYVDREKFDAVKWKQVMDFLIKQPEQPITVTLYDSLINISCIVIF